MGFGQGLIEPAGLFVVQVLGVGDHDGVLSAVDDFGGCVGGQPDETIAVAVAAVVVDGCELVGVDGDEVGVV